MQVVASAPVDFEVIRPSPATKHWLVEEICSGGRIVATRRLRGGISSSVHRVTIESGGGTRRHVVLRQWPSAPTGEDEPSIANEAKVLKSLEATAVPAPRILAASEDVDGHPTLAMSHLPGRMDLAPRDVHSWIRQQAQLLPRIHDAPQVGQEQKAWQGVVSRGIPSWTHRPDLWREVERVLNEPAPDETCFIHGDFQHFNFLWNRGRLSGVVDWAWSGVGSPDRDVGHCRLNLAVLFSADLAERFRRIYESESGRNVDRWWDVHEIACYSDYWPKFIPEQVAGRVPIDLPGMPDRVEALLTTALA